LTEFGRNFCYLKQKLLLNNNKWAKLPPQFGKKILGFGKMRIWEILLWALVALMIGCRGSASSSAASDPPAPAPSSTAPPEPAGIWFADSDPDPGELGGTFTLQIPGDESSLTGYRLLWGSSATTPLDGAAPLLERPKTGADLSDLLGPNLTIPAGATHFLAVGYQAEGTQSGPTALAIEDLWTPASAPPPATTAPSAPTATLSILPGAAGLSVLTVPTASFSEEINPGTVHSGSFRLTQNGVLVPATLSYANKTARLTPTEPLGFSASFRLELTTEVRSAAGVALSAPLAVSFFTPLEPEIADFGLAEQSGCAALEGGMVECWGLDHAYQLEDSFLSKGDLEVPVLSRRFTEAAEVGVGTSHLCIRTLAGQVLCVGSNGEGQLGDGTYQSNHQVRWASGLTQVTQLASSLDSNCALKTDGNLYCWGKGGVGELGDGTLQNRPAPTWVPGLSGVTQFSLGDQFGCARLGDSTLKCWGKNTYGQLGDGSTTDRPSPVPVSGLTGVLKVAAGKDRACALLVGGTVSCWGLNGGTNRLLSDHGLLNQTQPAPANGLGSVQELAVGSSQLCALLTNGRVACWGGDAFGSAGMGDGVPRPRPTLVPGLTSVVRIKAKGGLTCAQLASKRLVCFGANGHGQTGGGNKALQLAPVLLPKLLEPTSLPRHSPRGLEFWDQHHGAGTVQGTLTLTPALDESDLTHYQLYWGSGPFTPLAGQPALTLLAKTGGNLSFSLPATAIPAGASHFLGVAKNSGGTLETASSLPVYDTQTPTDLVLGGDLSCVSYGSGLLRCWGKSALAQRSAVPLIQAPGVEAVAQLALGLDHGCTRQTSGGLQCWGKGASGQLGNGKTTDSTGQPYSLDSPVTLAGVANALQLLARDNATCALFSAGTVKCWGALVLPGEAGTIHSLPVNYLASSLAVEIAYPGSPLALIGRLPDGTVQEYHPSTGAATNLTALAGVAKIAAGKGTYYALGTDGTLKCWGSNALGQCGVGNNTDVPASAPVTVTGLTGVTQVAAQENHVCARKSDGTLWCWGQNLYGQLGNGTTAASNLPVQVFGVAQSVKVAVGQNHSCGLLIDGSVRCWGLNGSSQVSLGNPSAWFTLPVAAAGL